MISGGEKVEEKKVRLTYHLRKKKPIEHGIGIFADLKYFLAAYMVIGYGIYALTGHEDTMIRDAFVLAFAVVFSYILRNGISTNIILLVLQFCIIISSNVWCQYNNEKILCILFLAGWSIYSMAVRLKEKKERTFQNTGLAAILLGIPIDGLADYYHCEPVKGLVFRLGFLMILAHFLIKYMIDFMKYFEQAGQANITIKQIKLKSHLLLAGYGVIGMGVMLMMSRLPLQGAWNKVKHGIYLLLQMFFHLLEAKPDIPYGEITPTPLPTSEGTIIISEEEAWSVSLDWLRPVYDCIFEMISVLAIVVLILCVFKLIYKLFWNLNKKEKGIEEEKEFIHLSEIKKKKKEQRTAKRIEKENIWDNRMKVRRLFRQIMKKYGIEKYNNKSYMTSHEMCHLDDTKELNKVEKIYQKARYSKGNISEKEVNELKAQYRLMKEKGK